MSNKIYEGFCTSEETVVHNLKINGILPVKRIQIKGKQVFFYNPYDYKVYEYLAFSYSPECTIAK